MVGKLRHQLSRFRLGVIFNHIFPYLVSTILLLSLGTKFIEYHRRGLGFGSDAKLIDVFAMCVCLLMAWIAVWRPTPLVYRVLCVGFFLFFLMSSLAWMRGESCRCYGDFVSSGFVAVLDIALIAGCIGYARSYDVRSMDAKFSPTSMLLGAISGSILFLALVLLSSQANPLAVTSAWDEESLIGRDINSFIKIGEQRIAPVEDKHVVLFLYDTGCPMCLEHWRQTNNLPDRETRYPHAIAIWRLHNRSWAATDFSFQPTLSANKTVSFPSGVPYLPFPAMIEVKNSKIVNVQTMVEY